VFLLAGQTLIRVYLNGEGKPEDAAAILEHGWMYLLVMLWGLPAFAVSNAYAGTLRVSGETVVPMAASSAAVFVNLVLNWVLIFGHFGAKPMGVQGAAIATVISRYVELAIVAGWTHLHGNKMPFIRGAYRSLSLPLPLLKKIILKGMPLLINEALWSIGMATLNQCYSTRGLDVVPAQNISSTIYNLSSVVYLAMGNAVGIIIGQMLGAGRSEENVRNYNKMIVPDDANAKHYATEARGKVQNQNVYVELEPLYVLTYYSNDMVAGGTYYDKKLEELNASRTAESPLLLTNSERALAASEVSHHFGHIDDLSRFITGAGNDAIVRRERAMDYYLVQDLEAAMADIDNAVLADSTSWSSYFMRAFIRYKLLETDQLNDTGNSNGFTLKHTSALPDIDYRLVKNDLDRVIEIYPGFAVAYYNRANVSAKLNDFKSAIVDYTKAIEIDSRFAAAYYNRGLAKIYLGNNEGGVADLSKAGELGMYQAYNVIKRFKNAVRR
jgi:tetratricopeptide (TPR) repeat protein